MTSHVLGKNGIRWAAGAVALTASAVCYADLMQNDSLGTLPSGVTTISVNTASGANNADYYLNLTNPAANWANEWVSEFTLAEDAVINLTLVSQTSDTDFFLLTGLGTTFDGSKNAATEASAYAFLDGGGTESFGFVPAGTYYISTDTFAGFDPNAAGPFTSSITLDIEVVESGPPTVFTDLGLIATAPAAFAIDTFGSDFDTELGIYLANGTLAASNDDAGGTLQSQISFPNGARPGIYYMALGGFNTVYNPGFAVTPGAASGSYLLTYPTGSQSGTLSGLEWFRFEVDGEIAPPPTDFIDLGVIGTDADAVVIDTFGSDFDTELGLYDSDGFLLGANDDSGGTLQSMLSFGSLPDGLYYIGLGGFNTVYGDAFAVTPGAATGNWVLTANSAGDSGFLAANTAQWLRFQIGAGSGCVGDLDGDNDVDLTDLGLLLANFGTAGPTGDVDGDGDVDLTDLGLILSAFGQPC